MLTQAALQAAFAPVFLATYDTYENAAAAWATALQSYVLTHPGLASGAGLFRSYFEDTFRVKLAPTDAVPHPTFPTAYPAALHDGVVGLAGVLSPLATPPPVPLVVPSTLDISVLTTITHLWFSTGILVVGGTPQPWGT